MTKHVEQWQTVLANLGHYGGKIDGDFGPSTLHASMAALGSNEAVPEPDKTGMSRGPLAPLPANGIQLRKTTRPINELIWHCSATPEGKDFTVADIRAWHRKRGWDDVGYHYVVYRDGSIHAGRPVEKVGAHVEGRNTGTIGAVYIGGTTKNGRYAKDTRTPEQREAMLWLTKELARMYALERVSGHNQYANKACPSFDVRRDELGNIPGYSQGRRN